MKKLSFVKAFLAASALALIVPGCSDFGTDENNVGQTAPSGKVALKVNIGNGYDSLRTALPSAESIALSQYTYSLLAESTEKAYIFGSAESGVAYSTAVSPKAAYIDKGTYKFVLTAFDASGKAILAGALNQEITEENNTLAFKLYAATENSQEGTVAITVNYPTDMGVTVLTAKVYEDAGCSGDGTELAVNGTGENGALEEGKRLVSGEISAGESFVKITLSDGAEEIGSVTEAVYAVEGMVSSSNIAVEAEKFLGTVKLLDATIGTAKEIKVKAVINGTEKGNFISLDKISSDNKTYQAYLTAGLSYNVYVGDDKKDGVVISDVTEKEFYAEKDLSGIEIAWAGSSAPTVYVNQTDYEDVILSNILVKRSYSNGEEDSGDEIKTAKERNASLVIKTDEVADGFDVTSAGSQTVNVSLDGKTAAIGLPLSVLEDEIEAIEVTQVPSLVEYKQNEGFAPAGMNVTATYKSKHAYVYTFTADGITKIESGDTESTPETVSESPFTFSPEDFRATTFEDAEETANVDVTISMIDGSVTKTATQTVTVTKVNEMLPYEFDFNLLAKSGDSTGATNITADTNTTYDGGVILVNGSGRDGNLRIRKTVNGDTATYAFNVQNNNASGSELPSINSTVASLPAFYIGVDISSTETLASKVLVSFNVKATGSNKGSADAYVFLVDNNKKILASMVLSEVSGTTAAGILSGTVTDLSSKVYLGFSRGSGTGGGIDITGITVVDPDKIQSAPDATKFNTVSAALNADDGKITVSEFLTNENGAKLEYKLSSATEWTEATASIENLAAGVYEFRYAALPDGSKSASPSVSVTVFGAKSLELDSKLYTITPKAEGGVVSATTTIATAELSEGKVSVKSVAAGSSVITITDTYGNSEELTVTVSAIGTITAKSTKALGKIKATDTVAVTSSGESPLTVAKDDVVTLTATPTIAAANPEKLTYQWYSKVGDEEVSEIDGATSATYTVTASAAGTVFYSVKVKGTISTEVEITSGEFIVTVVDSLTKITDETVVTISSSAESSVEEGTKVTLTASINGYDANSWEAVTYQWYKKVGEADAVVIENATSVTYEYTTTADDVTASPTFIVTVTGASSDESKTESVTITVTEKAFPSKTETINNDVETLGIIATSATSSDESIATVELSNGIVITSVAKGAATVTCTDDNGNVAIIAVTVAEDGSITKKIEKDKGISALTAVGEGEYNMTTDGTLFVKQTAGDGVVQKSKDSHFIATCSIDGNGLNLKNSSAVYFRVESKMFLTFTDSNSKGVAIYAVTSAGTKKIETPLTNSATPNSYSYELNAGMYEIVGTTSNSARIASLKFESAVFAATSETVENTESKLGLVATGATSSDTGVVTVSVNNGIVITSVAKGSATITCKDAEDHEATIAVTVSGSGAITVGTITKYVAEGGDSGDPENPGVKSWLAGEDIPSWLTGVNGSAATWSRKAFKGVYSKYIEIAKGSSFKIIPNSSGIIKIYICSGDTSASEISVTNGVSTENYTLVARDTENYSSAIDITAESGEELTITVPSSKKKAALFAILLPE